MNQPLATGIGVAVATDALVSALPAGEALTGRAAADMGRVGIYPNKWKRNTMERLLFVALLAAGVLATTAAAAQTFSLTNRDSGEQVLTITEGGDEPVEIDVIIHADETLHDFCSDGCVITLQSGEQASFEGDETVYIENGELVVAE